MSSNDEDYEHWPEASKHWKEPAASAAGYDSHNGLHTHSYLAAKDPFPVKSACPSPAPEAAESEPASFPLAPQPVYYPHPAAAYGAPPQYYAVPQPMPPQMYSGYPQHPGYYAYPEPNMAPAAPVIAVAPPAPKSVTPPEQPTPKPVQANTHFYVPRFTGTEEETVIPQPSAWLGRTKAQVETDNQKIAKAEGAWDARKMVPSGVPDDQMCWVIELDNTKTLRTFLDIKGLTGSWKRDPRYPDAWYFIREEEEEKK